AAINCRPALPLAFTAVFGARASFTGCSAVAGAPAFFFSGSKTKGERFGIGISSMFACFFVCVFWCFYACPFLYLCVCTFACLHTKAFGQPREQALHLVGGTAPWRVLLRGAPVVRRMGERHKVMQRARHDLHPSPRKSGGRLI